MSLATYEPIYAEIQLPNNNSFRVRGLSTEDISLLVQDHFADIGKIVDKWGQHGDNVFTNKALEDFALNIVKDIPILASKIIALASGELDQLDKIRTLSFPIQLEALIAAFTMSFEEVGGVKKFWGRVRPNILKLLPSDVMENLKKIVEERQPRLPVKPAKKAS